MQILVGVLLAFAALLRVGVSAQVVADTGLEGTWSTGSGAVETGQKYFNIVNDTFTVPPLTGQAYSFQPRTASTGYYEELIYKFNTSIPQPGCYIAVLLWQHGNYTINKNNSITMTPFAPDGRQQVEEFMQRYEITTYLHYNQPTYKLQLYDFDGSMKPSMYLKYRPAAMYPTMPLHMNVIGVDS
ncbi:ROT1 [Malassezia furfur]|nr:ROT1 [Malassezia furfur]